MNLNILKSDRLKKMNNPAKLKYGLLYVTNKLTSLIFDNFFSIIENTLGLLIASIDIRRRKKIGNKILICRDKHYSLKSGLDSMDKYHFEEPFTDSG